MNVTYPSNVADFMSSIAEMVNFQILPTDGLDAEMYNVQKDNLDAFNSNFKEIGHETLLYIHNIGAV